MKLTQVDSNCSASGTRNEPHSQTSAMRQIILGIGVRGPEGARACVPGGDGWEGFAEERFAGEALAVEGFAEQAFSGEGFAGEASRAPLASRAWVTAGG